MKLPSRNSVTGLELDAEKRRSFAPFALEPMTTDTWHQPEKRLQSDVPFTCGGDL